MSLREQLVLVSSPHEFLIARNDDPRVGQALYGPHPQARWVPVRSYEEALSGRRSAEIAAWLVRRVPFATLTFYLVVAATILANTQFVIEERCVRQRSEELAQVKIIVSYAAALSVGVYGAATVMVARAMLDLGHPAFTADADAARDSSSAPQRLPRCATEALERRDTVRSAAGFCFKYAVYFWTSRVRLTLSSTILTVLNVIGFASGEVALFIFALCAAPLIDLGALFTRDQFSIRVLCVAVALNYLSLWAETRINAVECDVGEEDESLSSAALTKMSDALTLFYSIYNIALISIKFRSPTTPLALRPRTTFTTEYSAQYDASGWNTVFLVAGDRHSMRITKIDDEALPRRRESECGKARARKMSSLIPLEVIARVHRSSRAQEPAAACPAGWGLDVGMQRDPQEDGDCEGNDGPRRGPDAPAAAATATAGARDAVAPADVLLADGDGGDDGGGHSRSRDGDAKAEAEAETGTCVGGDASPSPPWQLAWLVYARRWPSLDAILMVSLVMTGLVFLVDTVVNFRNAVITADPVQRCFKPASPADTSTRTLTRVLTIACSFACAVCAIVQWFATAAAVPTSPGAQIVPGRGAARALFDHYLYFMRRWPTFPISAIIFTVLAPFTAELEWAVSPIASIFLFPLLGAGIVTAPRRRNLFSLAVAFGVFGLLASILVAYIQELVVRPLRCGGPGDHLHGRTTSSPSEIERRLPLTQLLVSAVAAGASLLWCASLFSIVAVKLTARGDAPVLPFIPRPGASFDVSAWFSRHSK